MQEGKGMVWLVGFDPTPSCSPRQVLSQAELQPD